MKPLGATPPLGDGRQPLTGSLENVICLRWPSGVRTWCTCAESAKRVVMSKPSSCRKPAKALLRVFW